MAIRTATLADLPQVYDLICELAEYEKAPNEVTLSLNEFKRDYLNDQPDFGILVAERDNKIIGMALYFFTYSTWKGRCLYLEDMIVTQEYRKQGVGKRLFERLIRIAADNHAQRMAWQVLDWNQPAIRFYEQFDAYLDPEWINGKLTAGQIRDWGSV